MLFFNESVPWFGEMMKKIFFSFLFAAASLAAAPHVVVFDWGKVLANGDNSVVENFLCETFHLSQSEFAIVNKDSDVDFWIRYAKEKKIQLPNHWAENYSVALKASLGVDLEMMSLVNELKEQKIRVGLLSNIKDRFAKIIRNFGFYQPFEPCLLSCEMGLEKPDPNAFKILLQAVRLPAKEVLFIDDRPENVEAAKQMGIDAILFESSKQVRCELAKRGLKN